MALKLDTVKKLRQEIRNNLDRYQPGSSGFEFDNDDGRLIGRKFHQNDIPDLAPTGSELQNPTSIIALMSITFSQKRLGCGGLS